MQEKKNLVCNSNFQKNNQGGVKGASIFCLGCLTEITKFVSCLCTAAILFHLSPYRFLRKRKSLNLSHTIIDTAKDEFFVVAMYLFTL